MKRGPGVAALLVCLLFAVPAQAEEKRALLTHAVIGSYVVASAMDNGATMWCRGAQTCREANRALRPFENNPLLFSAVKTAVTVGVATVLIKQHKKHPVAVRWLAAGLTASSVYIAVRNTRTGKAAR